MFDEEKDSPEESSPMKCLLLVFDTQKMKHHDTSEALGGGLPSSA